MNTVSFVFAIAAVISFVVAAFGGSVKHPAAAWNWVAIGLALVTVAWILQLVLAAGSKVTLS